MLAHFSDKTTKVLICDTSNALRTMLGSVLRDLGFKEIMMVFEIKDALSMLETERYDWIITRLQPEGEANGLDLLKIALEHRDSMGINASFLLDEEHQYCLGKSLEMGLLSYHPRYQTKEGLTAEITELIKNMQVFDYDSTLVAACYVRKHLIDKESYKLLNTFERTLIDKPCCHPQIIEALANSQLLMGDRDQGLMTLKQAMFMDPSSGVRVQDIAKAHDISPKDLGSIDDPFGKTNILGINHCLVVIATEVERNQAKITLSKMGFATLSVKSSAEEAIEFAKRQTNKPDLVIFEWALPLIPGPMFLQRIRKHLAKDAPIITLAKGFGLTEKPLLDELGVSKVVTAPHQTPALLAACVWAIQQNQNPKSSKILFHKIRNALKEKKFGIALNLRAEYFKATNVTQAEKNHLDAEIAFAKGNYDNCRNLCVAAMSLTGATPVSILNLLGKALMQLREFDAAVRCLQNANTISPLNLSRICTIAECHIENGNQDGYNSFLEQAKKIDDGSEEVNETKLKAALINKDSEAAKILASNLASLKSILAFTNNRGVALIKNQDYDAGEALYLEALQAMPKDNSETTAVLYYNLALAYARRNDLVKAEVALENAAQINQPRMRLKIMALKSKVKKSIASGERLIFTVPKQEGNIGGNKVASFSDVQIDTMMKEITLKYCCYKLFFAGDEDNATQINDLNKNKHKFQPRKTLKKDHLLGLTAV